MKKKMKKNRKKYYNKQFNYKFINKTKNKERERERKSYVSEWVWLCVREIANKYIKYEERKKKTEWERENWVLGVRPTRKETHPPKNPSYHSLCHFVILPSLSTDRFKNLN